MQAEKIIMDNISKPRGVLNSQKPEAGGAGLRTLPLLGIVKDITDPTRSGRIRVYISAFGSNDPNDEKNWTPILYMSPFFGRTNPNGGKTDYGSFKSNPASYGVWNSPPDVGTTVICLFINGDPNFGFYIGSIPESEAMRMVPAIGANLPTEDVIFNSSEAGKYGGADRVPVTNMNVNNSGEYNSDTFLDSPKPVHSFQASVMFQQGILRDNIRGPISSSSQRESPSRVGWGVSTPGRPIYEGGYTDETIAKTVSDTGNNPGLKLVSRRGGHTFVMDDGDLVGQDNLIRIRTSLGHQITMSDDGQTLLILHSNGQSYIELGKEGTIDMYSTNSVNIRTHGDLNLHADNNININAKKQINMHSDELNINTDNDTNHRVGKNYKIYTHGTHTNKVDGPMSFESAGDSSFVSKSTTYINGGPNIHLNTGASSTVPQEVLPIPIIAQTDTLFSKDKGWAAAPCYLPTIVSRVPAHMPWANAGQGVDVKVNLDADSQFPSSPNSTVETANNTAATNTEYPAVTVSGTSTVPPVSAASQALDKGTTSALVSASAVQAATGSAAAAVQAGAGVVKDALNKVTGLAAGIPGLSAQALEAANIIKPGAGQLATALAQAGKSVSAALPPNLFTGQNGVPNLSALVNNTTAQASAVVANLQQSQSLLTQSGVISGKEGPAGIAGAVLSAASNGISATVNAIKNVGSALVNPIAGIANSIQGATSSVMKSIAGGNFAASLSQNLTSGLSGISSAVSSMTSGLGGLVDKTKGLAASAFASITSTFKSFEANIPQNIKGLIKKPSIPAVTTADPYEGLTQEQKDNLGDADASDPYIRARLGLPALSNGVSDSTAASATASGVGGLPGGVQTVASVVNKAGATANTIPGVSAVRGLINNATTASTNGISVDSAINAAKGVTSSLSSAASKLTGAIPNAAALTSVTTGLTSALDSLKSGASSLTALASSGLPANMVSQLNTAVSALSSGGPIPVKMPTVASGTIDRDSVTAAVDSLVPAGVPKPNFTGVSSTSKSTSEATQAETAKNTQRLQELNLQYEDQKKMVDKAEEVYFKTKVDNLPGDPAIQHAQDAWDAERQKLGKIGDEISSLLGINLKTPNLPNQQALVAQLNKTTTGIETFFRTNPFTGKVGEPYKGSFESGSNNNNAGG